MKDETYLFDDGTEPTVRRLPRGCDQQGRYPEAAEAATEVGQDDSNFYTPRYASQFMLEELSSLLAWALGIFAVVVLLGFLVGVLV
jgi:hypothetical protein